MIESCFLSDPMVNDEWSYSVQLCLQEFQLHFSQLLIINYFKSEIVSVNCKQRVKKIAERQQNVRTEVVDAVEEIWKINQKLLTVIYLNK
jgi:hypothetical protein